AASHDASRRPTPWAKYSDPLGPSSLAPLSEKDQAGDDDDDLRRAAKDMFDWTQSDRPAEESLGHMERIVHVCQDEASWSGDKRWDKVVAAYKSCGASPDALQDLKDAREPFWTQSRVKHASTTLATPKALADSIRTMLTESERANGHYLDRNTKDQLIKAVERVFPRTQRSIWVPDDSPMHQVSQPPRQTQVLVAPVAPMVKNDNSPPQALVSTASQQAPSVPPVLRLASKPPGWAPGLVKGTKPRVDSLADASSSRKSSAATLIISSPLQISSDSPTPKNCISPVVTPKRRNRFGPEVTEPASTGNTPTKLVTAPIHFKIATSSGQAPPKRPRLNLDSVLPRESTDDVFPTPLSSESRRSSTLSTKVQPPTGPRSVPRFQAKIIPKEPLENKEEQKQEIFKACDYNRISAQDATPCPSDPRTWILHFQTPKDLHNSFGKTISLREISTTVLAYAPNQSFQVFALVGKSSSITLNVEADMIKTISRTLHPAKFNLLRQKSQQYNARSTRRWIVVFEEPLDRDNFTLDMQIGGRRETLEFFGLNCSGEVKRCWVCSGYEHIAPSCANYTEIVKLLSYDSHYLQQTPQLK
ncbi:hypothetical protein E4T45_06182, partial [Aureobasidium sp. EXF-8846]